MNIRELLKIRDAGVLRLAFVNNVHSELACVLHSLGLAAEPHSVHAIDRADAIATIERILWKDLAYNVEIMPRATARAYAEAFLREYAGEGCTLYSNGDWQLDHLAGACSWSAMTSATFDAGVVIVGADYATCLWVEDED